MEIVGYALIKKDAKSGVAKDISKFTGKICRVFEFAVDGGCLVIDSEATELAMFDKEDILSKFECSIFSDYICPPNINMVEQIMYANKCMLRKGGYNTILRNMVIHYSLHKGEFTDSFLWQKQ